MKKILLSLVCAFFCLTNGMAQRYQDYSFSEQMVITTQVNKELPQAGSPQASQQLIRDSKANMFDFFWLQNLTITGPNGTALNLGEVQLNPVTITTGEDGLYYVSYDGTYDFDTSNVPGTIAESFKNVPVKLEGKFIEGKLYAVFTAAITLTRGSSTSKLLVTVKIGQDNIPTTKIYTEPLVVTINGESTPSQQADIEVVDKKNGTIDFKLKNFILVMGENQMPIGNIALSDIAVTESEDGLKHFSYNDYIFIQPGDLEGYSEEDWYGPFITVLDENENPLGIPIVLNGVMNDENLYVTIDIDMVNTGLGQMIHVTLGSKYLNGIDYTESYTVSVNGDTPSEPEDVVITIDENSDNTIDFVLRNFSFNINGSTITIDEFSIDDITTQEGDGELINFYKEGTLSIPTNGLPSEFKMLIAAGVFDNVPFTIDGKYTSDKLFATINLDVASQKIDIVVGTDDFVVNVKGDNNGDGEVNLADAQTILGLMARDADVSENPAADVNGDNEINLADYQTVLGLMAQQ